MSAQIFLMLIAAGAAVFAAYGLPRALAWRAEQLEIQKSFMTDFFTAAEELAEMNDVPEWMMTQLDALAALMMNGSAVRRFVFHVFTGRFQQFIQDRDADIRRQRMEIMSLNPAVRGFYLQAVVCGMLAITYSAPFFGVITRRTVLAALKRPDRSKIYQDEVPDRQALGAVSDLTACAAA